LDHGKRRRKIPSRAKRLALDGCVKAINERGGFGVWSWDVVKGEPAKVDDTIVHHATTFASTLPIGEAIFQNSSC
jgi:type III restriction enzyme